MLISITFINNKMDNDGKATTENIYKVLLDVKKMAISQEIEQAKLAVLLGALENRMSCFEKININKPIAVKRSIKLLEDGVEDGETTVSTETSKKENSPIKEGKVINNALTWFKVKCIIGNIDNYRSIFKDEIEASKQTIKTKKKEDSDEYWNSIGHVIWRGFSKEKKAEMTHKFKKWQDNQTRDTASDQLDVDTIDENLDE